MSVVAGRSAEWIDTFTWTNEKRKHALKKQQEEKLSTTILTGVLFVVGALSAAAAPVFTPLASSMTALTSAEIAEISQAISIAAAIENILIPGYLAVSNSIRGPADNL